MRVDCDQLEAASKHVGKFSGGNTEAHQLTFWGVFRGAKAGVKYSFRLSMNGTPQGKMEATEQTWPLKLCAHERERAVEVLARLHVVVAGKEVETAIAVGLDERRARPAVHSRRHGCLRPVANGELAELPGGPCAVVAARANGGHVDHHDIAVRLCPHVTVGDAGRAHVDDSPRGYGILARHRRGV